MIVIYDYLLFALELAGILYFMSGLPIRTWPVSEATSRIIQGFVVALVPLLLAFRSGLDGIQADQYGAFRLIELFVILYVFVRIRYRISAQEALYYTFILFLVEIAVEKAAAAIVLSQEGMDLAEHEALLQFSGPAFCYLILPAGLTFLIFFALKRFCITVQPKKVGWRELVPMALSMVPVLAVGYLTQALDAGSSVNTSEPLGLLLYELCSLTSVLVMIGVDNAVAKREAEQSAHMLEAVVRVRADQYEQRRRSLEEIRRKHHDLKHHLLYMAHIPTEEERVAYANEALETSFGDEQFLQTGNEVLDAVLSMSAQRCREHDIRLALFVEAQAMSCMRSADIVTIAGNALDNAIEAQMRLPAADAREILVRIHGDNNWLYLHFENKFSGTILWRDGFPLSQKDRAHDHGLGLRSIQSAVDRYKGSVEIDVRESVFSLNILIPRTSDTLGDAL